MSVLGNSSSRDRWGPRVVLPSLLSADLFQDKRVCLGSDKCGWRVCGLGSGVVDNWTND